MPNKLLAILFDCGDTIVDEGTEVKDETGTSLRAELIPGAAKVVQELKARGYKLALVADGPAATFVNNLSPYGLYELFDAFAISEVLGVEKPDARMFHHALGALDIRREDYNKVIMVGNNLERDIIGANELGILSVWLNWSPRRRKTPINMAEVPNFTIHNPNELLGLIEELETWLSST